MDRAASFEGLCNFRLVQEGDREGRYDYSARNHQGHDKEDEQQTLRAGNRLDDGSADRERRGLTCFLVFWAALRFGTRGTAGF